MQNYCNICKKKFKTYLNLGKHPCADSFLSNRNLAKKIKKYPLIVGYCNCHHLTATYKISEHQRYNKFDYSYTSSNSPVSLEHFKNIAKKICKNFAIKKNSKVLEIASNDGTFLYFIRKFSKAFCLGIDPSKYMCKIANKKKLKTESIYFNSNSAKKIKNKYGKFDLIYGANVFNHIDDPINFIKGCKKILNTNGILVIEVPDLDKLIKNISYDTIYHEHRNYYSKKSLIKVFEKTNLKIIKFENLEYMSGSLRIFVKNSNFKKFTISNKSSIQNYNAFFNFKKKISLTKKYLIKYVKNELKKNKIIAGFGAATKGNTLINFCKFNSKHIKFIMENSKHKIGKFTPGSAIPIVDEKKVLNFNTLIILPWNIKKYLVKKILKFKNVNYISLKDVVKKINY